MIVIELILEKRHKTQVVNSAVPVFNRKNLLAPTDYYFSKGHTWASESSEGVKIGLDDFVLNAMSNVLIKKVLLEGTKVKEGDILFEGEVENKKINFRSPITGTIKKVNNSIFDRKINNAYEDGWGVIMEKSVVLSCFKQLKTGVEAVDWMKSEFKRLKEFLNVHSFAVEPVGATMYDGGNVVRGAVSRLNEKILKDFEEQFLNIEQ